METTTGPASATSHARGDSGGSGGSRVVWRWLTSPLYGARSAAA